MSMVVFAIRTDETHLKSGLPSKGKKGVKKVAILAAKTLLIMLLLIMPSRHCRMPTPIPQPKCIKIAIVIANVLSLTSSPSSRVTVSMSG